MLGAKLADEVEAAIAEMNRVLDKVRNEGTNAGGRTARNSTTTGNSTTGAKEKQTANAVKPNNSCI